MNNNIKKGIIPYLGFFALVVAILFLLGGTGYENHNITYEQFIEYAKSEKESEQIEYIDVTANSSSGVYTVTGQLNGYEDKETFSFTVTYSDAMIEKLYDLGDEYDFSVKASRDPGSSTLLYFAVNVLPFLILGFVVVIFLTKQMGAANKSMDFGRSRARLSSGDKKVTFKDVAGLDEEKEEVQELIDFLKEPKKFQKMGARIPKGVLLVGPPGTGKTLLARAVAGEANVPFYFISGSDFVELFVGIGASRVRDMFRQAKHNAPCLIFIDEIDAVGRQRGAGLGGGHDEREQTLNQLLTEMDGFGANEGIIILAATNRPDVLDPALLRPGRFDRQITVNLPDVKGREAILGVHARDKFFARGVNLANIAKRTAGFSGADLENLLNEAALLAVRRDKDKITMSEIDEAHDRVLMGPAKVSHKYTEREKEFVAYHEAGHAVVGIKLDGANDVQKITIVPRGTAGGYNLMLPKEENFLSTKKQLLETISGLLGGRVAEIVKFGEMTTGAHNDFEKATKIARSMVTEFGMSSLGPVQFEQQSESSVFLGRDYNKSRNFSGQIAFQIDEEVRAIINKQYAITEKIIKDNMDLLDLIAKTLIEKETLTKEEIDSLVNNGKLPEEELSLEDMTIAELKEYASKKDIDLKSTKKEDIINELKDALK